MTTHVDIQTGRPQDGTLLDRKALAARWLCSIETIKRREKDGTLDPVYLPGGRLVRYRVADIEAIENPAQ